MMVRQPQSKANAGAWDNGLPMTSSLGCGVWGGNITNENIGVKHYMQTDLGEPPDPRGPPSEEALFGGVLAARRGPTWPSCRPLALGSAPAAHRDLMIASLRSATRWPAFKAGIDPMASNCGPTARAATATCRRTRRTR